MAARFDTRNCPGGTRPSAKFGGWSALSAILMVICVTCSIPTLAAETELETVEKSQPATSTLAFHYPPDPISKNRTEFPMIVLADMPDKKRGNKRSSKTKTKAKSRLRLGRKVGLQTIEVPAGRYYVRLIKSDNLNFQRSPRPVPKSEKGVVEIPPGVVAYLGNVNWDADLGTQMGFSKEGLLELQGEATLHSKPLYLVAFGMEPRPVSWE